MYWYDVDLLFVRVHVDIYMYVAAYMIVVGLAVGNTFSVCMLCTCNSTKTTCGYMCTCTYACSIYMLYLLRRI